MHNIIKREYIYNLSTITKMSLNNKQVFKRFLNETSEFDALNKYGNSFHNFVITCISERSPAVI